MSEHEATPADRLLDGGATSLLDAVDGLLNRGVLVQGDIVLGLADVDLIYLRLSTLLAAADRVLGTSATPPPAKSVTPAPPRSDPPSAAPAVEMEAAGVDALSDRIEQTLDRRGGAHEAASTDGHDPGTPIPPAGEQSARLTQRADPGNLHWNAAPDDVERSVARLVLALVNFLRLLMERQTIRRMEEGTLTETEVERLGQALMRLEQTVRDMARRFDLDPDDLNLDLGPLGSLT